jgi:hypothetical protein
MFKVRIATGWLAGVMLFSCTAVLPRAASAATCNGFVGIDYVGSPPPAVVGDIRRVQMTVFTGPIVDGANPTLTFQRIRFDLDCNADFALGLPCTDDGSVIKYKGNISAANCLDASLTPVTFTDNSAVDNFNPNEVVFTPSNPVVIPSDTPNTSGCVIEFDVQVASYSNDSSPNDIEQVVGFRTILGVPDAACSNGLGSNGSNSAFISLVPPTPTPTSTIPPTNTLPPTNSPTPTLTTTPTPTGTPAICPNPAGGYAGLIPGYCHTEANDCLSEVCSYAVPPPGTNVLHPPNDIVCHDGDPSCDFSGGEGPDGVCTFKVSLCFNVTDLRFPCVLQDRQVTRVHFTDPAQGRPPRNATDQANLAALEAALLGLPGAAITSSPVRSVLYTPALANGDICTAPVFFNVPLRQTPLGPRSRHKSIRYRVFPTASSKGVDRDILRLTCTPAQD